MPFHFEQVPSTQSFLKELHTSDPKLPHLEYAIADSQTEGVGRMGRSWISDSGNLYLSVWIRDFTLPLTWVPHWVGVSLIEALKQIGVAHPELLLKWPNDLVFEKNRKVGGVLCEKVGEGIIAGIGVNLISAPALNDRATSSIHAIAPELDVKRLNVKLAHALIERLRHEPALPDLQNAYLKFSLLRPGSQIHWLDLQTSTEGHGTFLRYGAFGELIALEQSGAERPLYSEEVKLVIPAP